MVEGKKNGGSKYVTKIFAKSPMPPPPLSKKDVNIVLSGATLQQVQNKLCSSLMSQQKNSQ